MKKVTKYDDAKKQKILAEVAAGESATSVADKHGIPKGTLYTWLSKIGNTKITIAKKRKIGTINMQTGEFKPEGKAKGKIPQVQDAKSFLSAYIDIHEAEGRRPTKKDGLVILALAELMEIK